MNTTYEERVVARARRRALYLMAAILLGFLVFLGPGPAITVAAGGAVVAVLLAGFHKARTP